MFKMSIAPHAQDARVFTYLTLRKAVGFVAVGLPFALAIPWWFVSDHAVQSSISGYYYTGMRNLFVGSLCAISMFLLCCRGFDWKDEVAGIISAACALGVAFCPTTPDLSPTPRQQHTGEAHYTFAVLLFSTLAYFCLVLFRMSAHGKIVTSMKVWRNRFYIGCGCLIIASMLVIAVTKIFKLDYSIAGLGPVFCFETTSLLAFGVAWLIKGEAFLKDV